MDQATFPLASNYVLFLPNFKLLVLLLFPLVFVLTNFVWRKSKPIPPGPKPWPIIGNIPHLGKYPHISSAQFSKTYGPLISFRLGTQLLVVGCSPKAACEILKTYDRLLADRFVPNSVPQKREVLDKMALLWASNLSDQWKSIRALCRTELFSTKALESQAILREKKVLEMVEYITHKEGQIVGIGKVVFNTIFNMLSNIMLSKDLLSLEDKGDSINLKSIVWRMLQLLTTPNIVDYYPVFGPLDPQGMRRELRGCTKKMFKVWEACLKERRDKRLVELDAPKNDFLDVFLANGFNDDRINWLLMELFGAGTDTSSTTIEWTMAELIKSKQVMNKVLEELKQEGIRYPLKESQISQLPYLNACVKETLRLHPPVPLLLPHRALESCEVMGYTIPKNSQVLVNLWAIGHDPSIWKDPLTFWPERFLGSNLDYKGQDYEFIPFGSGRRICPGYPMAIKQVPLILASLLHCFDWSIPNDGQPENLDMVEKFGTTLEKKHPLLLIPKSKIVK